MKVLIYLFLCLNFSWAQSQTIRPEAGLYTCKKGNEASICDQLLKPYFTGKNLTAISVEYVGWCGSMGPYTYYCQNDICENAGLRFAFIKQDYYRWENKQYGFYCEFERTSSL